MTAPTTSNISNENLHDQILTEFKQVYKLHPADYTENCTNVVMSIIQQECDRARINELEWAVAYAQSDLGGHFVEKGSNRLAKLKDLNQGGEDHE